MKGPAADTAGSRIGKLGKYFSGDAWAAADASRSSPDDEGVKMGSVEAADAKVFISQPVAERTDRGLLLVSVLANPSLRVGELYCWDVSKLLLAAAG